VETETSSVDQDSGMMTMGTQRPALVVVKKRRSGDQLCRRWMVCEKEVVQRPALLVVGSEGAETSSVGGR